MKTITESSIIDEQAWNLIWPTSDSALGHDMLRPDTNLPLLRIGMNDMGNRAGGVSSGLKPSRGTVKQVTFGSGLEKVGKHGSGNISPLDLDST